MVQLRSIDYDYIRRLTSPYRTAYLPSSPFTVERIRRLGERGRLSSKELKDLIELGFEERGFTADSLLSAQSQMDDLRNVGQKQVDTLKERLEKSGHPVPESTDKGRQGLMGKIINALGATSGAVTTPVYDLLTGANRPVWESVVAGFTGRDRKEGHDIAEALGVKNRAAQAALGFGLDVLLDPTTYLGVGVARHAGTAVVKSAAKKALEDAGHKVGAKEIDQIVEQAIGPKARQAFATTDERVATVARQFGRPYEVVKYEQTDEFKTLYEPIRQRLDDVNARIDQLKEQKRPFGTVTALRQDFRQVQKQYNEAVKAGTVTPKLSEQYKQLSDRLQQAEALNKDLRAAYAERRALGQERKALQQQGRKNLYQIADVDPAIPRQYNLRMEVPFTNIGVNLTDVTPAMQKARQVISRLPQSTNPFVRQMAQMGAKVGRAVRQKFSAYPVPENVANLFRQRQLRIDDAMKTVIMQGEKVSRMLGANADQAPELHRAIAYSVEAAEDKATEILAQLPTPLRRKAETAHALLKKEFDAIAKKEVEHGILDPENVRQFYFTHLLSGDPEALKVARQEYAGGDLSALRHIGRFQQQRKAGTLEQLEQFVKNFNAAHPELPDIRVNYDIGQVLATRKLASEILVQNAKLVDNLVNLGPEFARKYKPGRPTPGFVHMKGINEKLDNYVIRSDVADFLQEWSRITRPDEFNLFVRTWDKLIGAMKATLTATPGFHHRNALGALWNNWMMGVKNPKYYTDAVDMIALGGARRLEKNEKALARKTVTLPDGRKLSGREVVELAHKYGLLRAGWMGDVGGKAIERIGRDTWLKKAARLEPSRQAGEIVDDTARLAGFLYQLEKHGDPWTAALEVKKHLFDYSELSKFEKKYMRRMVLFYTWMRKNIPLQLEALMRRPGMYTATEHAITEGAHAADIEPEEMPAFLANQAVIPLKRLEDDTVLTTTPYTLPASDLFELGQAMDSVPDFLRYLARQTNPAIQAIPEWALNRRFFDQMPIDREAEIAGEQTPGGQAMLNYLFQQSGLPYNIYRSATGQKELFPQGDERGENEFVYRSFAPFTPEGLPGIFAQYNPEYWEEEVWPYQYAKQLRGEVRRLEREGETVYTKQELDQAEKLGLSPEQVRIMRQILDEMGMRKTTNNLKKLYYQNISQ